MKSLYKGESEKATLKPITTERQVRRMNFRNFINSRFGVKQSDDSLNKKTDDCEKQPSYVIKSPHCGRDENGNFNCVCGKCVNQLPK